MTLIAKQFGFTNGAGAIANLVDGNLSTFWSPLQTDFATYPAQFFLSDKVTLNFGASFPALEFDLGLAKRVPQFFLKVETPLTLGPAILIGSEIGATSPADTLQIGDILLGEYRLDQIISNRFLEVPAMRDADIRRRFLRLLQRSNDPSVIAPTPGPANSVTFDRGAGGWVTLDYASTFMVEVWGAGASGGMTSQAQNGGATNANKMAGWSLTANGGAKATAATANAGPAGTGGTASGGNVANITGGNGSAPDPTSTAIGLSGKGGDAPFGGLGGGAVYLPLILGRGGANFLYGLDGVGPGGGGSGRSYWYPSGDVIYQKFPGGAAGGYSKSVFARGSGLADPGGLLEYSVGDGGVSSAGDGRGAQGRVRFSWT